MVLFPCTFRRRWLVAFELAIPASDRCSLFMFMALIFWSIPLPFDVSLVWSILLHLRVKSCISCDVGDVFVENISGLLVVSRKRYLIR
jgi:hypothetical protein